MPEALEDIDQLLVIAGRLASLREHQNVLAPFKGYVGGEPDADGDAFRKIEKFLEREARKAARTIAGRLN